MASMTVEQVDAVRGYSANNLGVFVRLEHTGEAYGLVMVYVHRDKKTEMILIKPDGTHVEFRSVSGG